MIDDDDDDDDLPIAKSIAFSGSDANLTVLDADGEPVVNLPPELVQRLVDFAISSGRADADEAKHYRIAWHAAVQDCYKLVDALGLPHNTTVQATLDRIQKLKAREILAEARALLSAANHVNTVLDGSLRRYDSVELSALQMLRQRARDYERVIDRDFTNRELGIHDFVFAIDWRTAPDETVLLLAKRQTDGTFEIEDVCPYKAPKEEA